MDKKQLTNLIDTVSSAVASITIFLLPVFFLTNMTDPFVLPKQLIIVVSVLLLLLLWGVKSIIEGKIITNANPLNLPVGIFGLIILISSILSPNRYDALMQAVPVLAAIFLFFIIVSTVKQRNSFSMVLASYVLGGAAAAIITVAYYLKIYFLPIPAIQNQYFNTFGSVLQELVYLLPIGIFSLFYIARRLGFPKVKAENVGSDIWFFVQLVTGIFVTAGILVIAYEIIATPAKPIILPYVYGFGIAFASISQDTSRFILSLLAGSGYGTFLVDFARFKLPAFNTEPNIWNIAFSFSSSYFLELIATTGVLGGLSFIFLIISALRTRAAKNPLFVSSFAAFVLALILPLSFPTVAALFVLLGLYVAYLNIENDKRVYDVVLSLVANKRGMLSFDATPEEERSRRATSPILPVLVFLIILVLVGFAGIYTYKFAVSDVAFAKSLVAAQQNNAQATYQLESSAINSFPFRSDYHRIFSQVNLVLANSVANGIPRGSSPSAQVQQNISTLLQQSINSGRNAVLVSPQTSVNWQNLSSIYRSLIGVGQNSEQFAISSANQAISLDPYNPQLYIQLGGIYYQLKLWDQAQNQFQIAINLKRDFINGYYNLGHALEEKGNLQDALQAYQIVKQLSVNNKQNVDQIDKEIKAIEDKIGKQKTAGNQNTQPPSGTDQPAPLTVNQPQTALPTGVPPIKISPPPAGPQATTSAK